MEDVNMDVWKEKIQQDVNGLKINQSQDRNDIKALREDVAKLQLNDKLQDKEISTLHATLSEIKDDTNWIRRKITSAIITAIITALITGIIAIAIANIFT